MKWNLFLLVFCLWFAGAEVIQAQVLAPVTVRISPESIEVENGGEVEIAVEIVAVTDLYAADVQLQFDPDVLEVVDANPGLAGTQIFLGTLLEPGFVLRNEADNAVGSIWFAMTQVNPSEAKSGTGNFVVVRFRGKQTGGTSQIMLENGVLVQRNGTTIPTFLTSGQIQVVEQVTAPTNTPLPTQAVPTPLPTRTPQPTSSISSPTPKPTAVFTQPTTQSPTSAVSDVTTTPSPQQAVSPTAEPDNPSESATTETAVSESENTDEEQVTPIVAPEEVANAAVLEATVESEVAVNSEVIVQAAEPADSSTSKTVIGEQSDVVQPIYDGTSQSNAEADSSSSSLPFISIFALLIIIIAVVFIMKRRAA